MSPAASEYLAQIEGALADQNEERVLDAVANLIEAEPANAALLVWTRFHSEEDTYFRRVLAYALAKTATSQSKYLWAPIADYVVTLFTDDEGTIINLLTALQLYDECDQMLAAVLAPAFGSFALSCTRSGSHVINTFCDLVVNLGDRGLLESLLTRFQVRAVIESLRNFTPSKERKEKAEALAILSKDNFAEILPDCISLLDQETENLDREPPSELDIHATLSLIRSVLARARSSYALRRQTQEAHGVAQEIRLTGTEPTRGRLPVDVFEKLIHSWKSAIRDAMQSVTAKKDSQLTTYMLVPAQGSFIMRFLVESAQNETLANVLDNMAELIERPAELRDSKLNPEARANIVQFAETLALNRLNATVGTLDPHYFERPRIHIFSDKISSALRAIRATKQEYKTQRHFEATLEGASRRQGTFDAHSEKLGDIKGEVPPNRKSLLLHKSIGSLYKFVVEERVTRLGTGEEKPQRVLQSLSTVGEGEPSLDTKIPEESNELSTNDVPQQDRLDRIVAVVRLLAREEKVLPKQLGMDDTSSSVRHIGYMRQAARILRLLAEDGTVTEAGSKLARLPESRAFDLLSIQFELSTVGRLWKAWAGVEDLHQLDQNTAEKFLLAKGLSDEMAKRRGRTLRKWVDLFKAHLTPTVETL